jgi:hypothetical protein
LQFPSRPANGKNATVSFVIAHPDYLFGTGLDRQTLNEAFEGGAGSRSRAAEDQRMPMVSGVFVPMSLPWRFLVLGSRILKDSGSLQYQVIAKAISIAS